jgi:hypothetical protein
MRVLGVCPVLLHVPEPSVEETYQILLGLRERYEAHHKLRYTDEALDSAAKYSSQYISDRFLPDKARARAHAPPAMELSHPMSALVDFPCWRQLLHPHDHRSCAEGPGQCSIPWRFAGGMAWPYSWCSHAVS